LASLSALLGTVPRIAAFLAVAGLIMITPGTGHAAGRQQRAEPQACGGAADRGKFRNRAAEQNRCWPRNGILDQYTPATRQPGKAK